jgi:hypothetical protein
MSSRHNQILWYDSPYLEEIQDLPKCYCIEPNQRGKIDFLIICKLNKMNGILNLNDEPVITIQQRDRRTPSIGVKSLPGLPTEAMCGSAAQIQKSLQSHCPFWTFKCLSSGIHIPFQKQHSLPCRLYLWSLQHLML